MRSQPSVATAPIRVVRPAILAPLLTLLFAAALPAAAAAQTLGGMVVEEISLRPIGDVEVQIIYAHNGNRVGPVLRTGADGRFGMRVPNSGTYELRFRRVGYHAQELTGIGLARNEVRNIEIVLKIQATTLAEVRVAPALSSRPFFMEGFEERRRMGVGTFFTREEIQRSGIQSLTNLIRGLAGVHVSSRPGRSNVAGTPVNSMRICNMVLFLDGAMVTMPTDPPDVIFRNFEMIPVQHIEALEVYRGRGSLPAQFGGPDVRCGAIVVWTRRPGLHDVPSRDSGQDAQKREVVSEQTKVSKGDAPPD